MRSAPVSEEIAKKFATEKETPYTRWVRDEGLDIIRSHLRRQPAHRGAQAVGAARRPRRVSQPRSLAHLERLLRVRDPGRRQEPRAAAPAVRGDDLRPRRARLDGGVERRRQPHHLRVEGGRAVRDPAQRLAPALQRLGQGAGALRRGDQRAGRHQPLRRHRFRLQHEVRLQGALRRRAGLLRATRASRRGSCSTPTSSPTPSTCRSSPPRSAARAAGTSASTWRRAR